MASTFHMHAGAGMNNQILLASTKAIDLNNKGYKMSERGDYQNALVAYHEALALKIDAYGPVSVHNCITLSGIADAYLGLKDYTSAEKYCKQMESIALEIKSAEQLRIAREIWKDIATAQGLSKPKLSKKEKKQSRSTTTSVLGTGSAANGSTGFSVEQPTKTCANPACPRDYVTASLKQCSKCKRSYYCGRDCQVGHHKAHKSECKRLAGERDENRLEVSDVIYCVQLKGKREFEYKHKVNTQDFKQVILHVNNSL